MFAPGDVVVVLTDRGKDVGTVRWVDRDNSGFEYWIQFAGDHMLTCREDDLSAVPKVVRGL